MPKEFTVHISSSLSDREWSVLELFCEKSVKLAQTKLLSGNVERGKATITFKDGQLIPEATLPPEEVVVEFLTRFRCFYLKKEDTYFPKVISILGKHTPDQEYRQALKIIQGRWENSLFRNAFRIESNGNSITTSVILDLWFNAEYFHSDKAKRSSLQEVIDSFGEPLIKYMLIDAAVGASDPILFIHSSLQEMVSRHASA